MILMNCNDPGLASILVIFKNILNVIWIVGPIVSIIALIIALTKMINNPDDKKVPKQIFNSLIALVVLFLIPAAVNAVMYMLGETSSISACWNNSNKISFSSSYIDPYSGKRKSVLYNPSDYEKGNPKEEDNSTTTNSSDTPVTACGGLEYCNKFLTSMVNNSKRLNDALNKNHGSVVYSNSGTPKSWSGALKIAESGGTVRLSCNRPSQWGVADVVGEYRDFWSSSAGGFKNYKGAMTKYTKQLKFDGSKSVKQAIQEGIIVPGDIIGVKAHTFSIYSVNKSTGSAVVFDGGHSYTNPCQQKRKCSTMFTYSSGRNASMRLYQIIRWVK